MDMQQLAAAGLRALGERVSRVEMRGEPPSHGYAVRRPDGWLVAWDDYDAVTLEPGWRVRHAQDFD